MQMPVGKHNRCTLVTEIHVTIYAGGRSVAKSLETSSLQLHSTRLLASENFLNDEIINEQFTRYEGVESQLNYSLSLSVVLKVL
jgi:hypothetical protein